MRKLIAALAALFIAAQPALAQQKPLVIMNGQTRQLPSGTTLVDGSNKRFITKETAAVNIYVDAVSGVDSATCGTGTGAAACKTLPQAGRNLCVNYDHSAVPTIHLTAGQTYTLGLAFKGGFAAAESKPLCSGIPTVILDGHGSTIDSSDSGAVMLYYVPMTLVVKNVTLRVSSTNGSPILVRGAGVVIMAEGVTIGRAGALWPQVWAYGGGQIASCPVSVCPTSTGITLTEGGQQAFLSTEAGAIQIEGTSLTLSGTPNYPGGFAVAFDGGITSFTGTTITGAATGDQFIASMGGIVNINAQTGGYTACANKYLPGDKCGQMYGGGRISQPGLPTATGCGTGCIVQGSEESFLVVFGTGLGSTAGTIYGPARVTFSTRTNYNGCSVQRSDPVFDGPWINVAAPTASANGFVDIWWKGSGVTPATKAMYITCKTS